MLSVKWGRACTTVSLHQMFLQAPKDVLQSLVQYLSRKQKTMAPDVKAYMTDALRKLDYSHLLDPSKLDVEGEVYNLQEIYDEVNDLYFGNKVKLNITWFGAHVHKNRSRVTFGLYHDQMKLVKINRVLDRISVPDYVVSFVIYHEMLHHVCPPYVDENGVNRIHNKAFKRREKQFLYYAEAEDWIDKNRDRFFKRRNFYGGA